jgi:type II secretory pathway pseudopilin PulG
MITAKRYSAQALAIVMIVLVISIVLGMAMLSRVLKDSARTVDEKSSAEALELADSVFDAVRGTSMSELKAVCGQAEYGATDITDGGECKASGVTQVRAFLEDVGVGSDATVGLENCQDTSSTVEIKTSVADAEDDYEIRPDSVRSFVLKGQTPNPLACELVLTVEPSGSSVGALTVSKIYGRNYVNGFAGELKPYSYNDTTAYCLYNGGSDCSANSNLLNSWTPVASGSEIRIALAPSGGYNLDEIRVRAVNSTLNIKSAVTTPGCIKDWEMVKMEVGANCTGSYRAKEIQIPQQDWALPIFDYVLYNGNGILQVQ